MLHSDEVTEQILSYYVRTIAVLVKGLNEGLGRRYSLNRGRWCLGPRNPQVVLDPQGRVCSHDFSKSRVSSVGLEHKK
jgi:hypothetical protein